MGSCSGLVAFRTYISIGIAFILRFRQRYNPVQDAYYTSLDEDISSIESVNVKGWKNGVKAFENMQRKEEQDWKMVSELIIHSHATINHLLHYFEVTFL